MIGRMIERARIQNGWTRETLSERTGNYVSEATIKRVERQPNYRISAHKLLALWKALGLEMNYLRKQAEEICEHHEPDDGSVCDRIVEDF